MLRYYSYYSIGGYKDLYLGSSEMAEQFTYYLPLLAIQKKKALEGDDKAAIEKISDLENLPKIKIVNKSNDWGLPSMGGKLISHGGYKLIFTHAENDTYILTLRDINGENKDESGRSIPFLVMIVADNTNDANKLASIAAYWSNHLNTVVKKISTMFAYDKVVNGIKFNLQEFNQLVNQSVYKQIGIETTDGISAISVKQDTVGALLVLPGITDKLILDELELQRKKVNLVPLTKVLPKDNPDKSNRMLIQAQAERKNQKRIKLVYLAIAGIIAIIGIIAYFITNWGK